MITVTYKDSRDYSFKSLKFDDADAYDAYELSLKGRLILQKGDKKETVAVFDQGEWSFFKVGE